MFHVLLYGETPYGRPASHSYCKSPLGVTAGSKEEPAGY